MRRARREAVLAAIARREWLLQMLVLAAGCGSEDRAYSRGNTLVMTGITILEMEFFIN